MAGMIVTKLDVLLYPEYGSNWDDEIFRQRILRLLRPDMAVLDFGAGRGLVKAMNFRGLVAKVMGVDVEPAVLGNPHLDEAGVLLPPDFRIPVPDGTFDLVFADNVMEHIEDPEAVLREASRVLKAGGTLIAKTPSRWHYMPLIARFTPTAFHRFYNRTRGRISSDTFPTVYRCNSSSAVARHAAAAGFRTFSVEFIDGRPEYLRIFWLTYLFGWIYERVVSNFSVLSRFRAVLIFECRKDA